jgi:alpha-beta hydrolase superfamily lysophospholipase
MCTEGYHAGLYHTLFEPDGQPARATVLLLHGMAEHHKRYADFAHHLTAQGFAVLAYDQLGHGRTAKSEEELGFFQLSAPAERVVQDAVQMAAYVASLFPGVPHFVLGHSMGSLVARCLLQQAGAQFAGAMLVGTAANTPGATLELALLKGLSKLVPRQRTKLLNGFLGWMNNRHFKEPAPNDATKWLSVDQPNQLAYLRDPLCGIPFTNNGFYTLLSLLVQATEGPWTRGIPQALPILLLSGEDDPVGQFGKGVRRVARQLQQAGFGHVKTMLYPGMRHEILNEVVKKKVYADVAAWLTNLVDPAANELAKAARAALS